MKSQINNHIYILSNLIISAITFFIICPTKYSKSVLMILASAYIITQLFINKAKIFKFFMKKKIIIYSACIWIIIHFIAQYIVKIQYIDIVNDMACAFIMMIYIYIYELKDKNSMKNILITSLATIILVNSITVIQLINNSDISRFISGASGDTGKIFGLGNYSYIYGLIFVILGLICNLYSRDINVKKKVVILIMAIVSIITIIKAQFVISYGILIIGLIMIIFNINNIKKFMILVIAIITIMFSGVLPLITNKIAKTTDSYIIKSRMSEITMFFFNYDANNLEDTGKRIELYNKSLNIILKRPLYGLMINGEGTYVGGHSAYLDEIARFGIFLSIPFFVMMYSVLLEIQKSINNEKGKNTFSICIICFTILGIVNTVMFVPMIFLLFVITPILCQNLKEEKNEGDIK